MLPRGAGPALLLALAPIATTAPAQAQASDLPAPWRRCDPPDAAGALWPDLRGDGTGAFVTWLRPDPDRRRQFALWLGRYQAGAFAPARELRQGRDFFANWADFASPCAASNGDVYVHYLRRGTDPHGYDAALLRRETGGDAFAELGTPYGQAGAGGEHGFVSMLPEGEDAVRLFWLDGRAYGAHQRMELRTAIARGGSFADEAVLDPDVCSCCQTGAAVTAKGALIAYRGRDAGEVRDVKVVHATGAGFSKPALVAKDGWVMPGCPVNGPAIAADGDEVAVAWFTAAAGKPKVRLAFSQDGGAVFAAPIDVDTEAPIGRVDVARTGRGALVVWLGRSERGTALCAQEWTEAGLRGPRAVLAEVPAGRESGFPRLERAGAELLVLWTAPQHGVRGARALVSELPPLR